MAIQLRPIVVTIAAPRQMVFQMLSAIGNGQIPGSQGDQARVLCRSDNTIIAEFHTKAGFRTYVTVEEVPLYPPERMTFRHVKGPLSYVWEEVTLVEEQGTTVLTYRGEFIANDWPVVGRSAGCLIGRLYVKPLFERVVGPQPVRVGVLDELPRVYWYGHVRTVWASAWVKPDTPRTLRPYRPLKRGSRFSAKAWGPSTASSVVYRMDSRA